MSPSRLPDFEISTLSMPTPYSTIGCMSTMRMRLRTADAPNVTEYPPSRTTRSRCSRLPGVRPSASASNST